MASTDEYPTPVSTRTTGLQPDHRCGYVGGNTGHRITLYESPQSRPYLSKPAQKTAVAAPSFHAAANTQLAVVTVRLPAWMPFARKDTAFLGQRN